MAILEILAYPDERLRKQAKKVNVFDTALQEIISNMKETMYHEGGIGLAATQTDIHQRIIVIDISEDKSHCLEIVNPSITYREGKTFFKEACLSVPDFSALVKRNKKITLSYQNPLGEEKVLEADGILSICIQHELDHLNGKLFVDHLSYVKRLFFEKKIDKMLKQL